MSLRLAWVYIARSWSLGLHSKAMGMEARSREVVNVHRAGHCFA